MKHLITPRAPFSFVADDLAIGGISAYALPRHELPFDAAINVAFEFHDTFKEDPLAHLPYVQSFRLDDTESPAEIVGQAREVMRAAHEVARLRLRGARVLITCAQGRNRSALVAATYLIQCGNRPDDVIAKIQVRRARALTNPAFVAWLRALGVFR